MEMMKFLVLLLIGCPAFASEEDWRVHRLNARYDDFFAREKQEEAYDERREAGAREVTRERQEWDKKMSIARLEFIRSKPPPPDLGPAYREWAAEVKKQNQQYEQSRLRYVETQNYIKKLEAKAKHIPGRLEYDLQDY